MKNPTFALLQKLTALLILLGIANLFALCLAIPLMSMMEMSMNDGLPCGIAHSAELCPMTLYDHLSFWLKVFVSSPLTWILLALLIALVVIVFSLKDKLILEALHRLRLLRYSESISLLLVDYLTRQFSQGIPHPKIY